MSEKKTAEEYKALGNEAFSKKDFKTAIEFYSKAILQEPKNHIFFSNRSASHAGLQDWESAITDAKECIRLNPEFIKGYYRLATAQLESKQYDAAEATIKQGLGIDANHGQLTRLLRNVKLNKKAAAAPSAPSLPQGSNAARQLDTATMREIHDLKVQYGATAREYNTVRANLMKAAKEEKMYGITLNEVKENPSATGDYYRSVGKLFMRQTQPEILDHLETNIESQKKKQQELSGKSDYLEKRLKSQQMNMKELAQQ
ncbi:unnamed protein product [Pseudo-nitzschia multistriata]|uniref:Hsp70-Hsp90 organising protein n=1 Tax=Pseudo-nitzschia multistriata TaxID=183589 RepID=A0A448Z218_9STRA|nr:unnamed protein product [Pseudo-nitzschia multistriata]